MAKKNKIGFRNEIIKDFTQEQIRLLDHQRRVMEKMSPEMVYRRIMYLLMEYFAFMGEYDFNNTLYWINFVEELGRLREQKDDGFYCYSLCEKLGSASKRLMAQIDETRVLFGILAYFMIKYIVNDNDKRKEYTIEVMKKLSKQNSIWEVKESFVLLADISAENCEISWGMRNFFGKANAIYGNKKFVRFLIEEFDEENHEFIKAWASFYVYLWNEYNANPSKLEGLLPNDTSERETDISLDDLVKELKNLSMKRQNALDKVKELTEKYSDAEYELRQLEKRVKELNQKWEDAKLVLSSMEAELKKAREEAISISNQYNSRKQRLNEYKKH